MRFSGTYFHNFRNLCCERREWPVGLNLITGPNGAGKTNFLEGLNLVSGWGPLEKNTGISNMISWGSSSSPASLWGGVEGEETVEISASIKSRCQLRRGGRAIVASDMRRIVPLLSFMPGHMSIVKGGSSYRRRLLDMTGVLISEPYARALRDYRIILRQKSAILRKRCDARGADRIMSSLASWLWRAREEIVKMLASAAKNFSDLMPRPMDFFFSRGGGGMDENPADDFKRSLARSSERERACCTPLVGPHRDDVRFICEGIDASAALSRGQSRRAVSVLILASATVVERKLSRKPILLFDEITSELDEQGRIKEMESLVRTGYQIFAATTDAHDYDGVYLHKMIDGRFL
jgi:DNA replication and repair protein RecF